jgi:tetratricopeptide (TPR) repeat protein
MTEPSLPEESLFAQALEIASATERAAFLDRACGDNQALRNEVEALLRAHEQSGDLLDNPDKLLVTTDVPGQERPGTMLGPYKLLERIGEGGMGTVWMAEQIEPIQRRVAVKVVKAGMDSRQVLARFEAERQALALMEHPNIAKVLDAGQTPSGRPYFVMELVKGKPITKYCDEKRLAVRERLELFGDVCRAVQHAHQKGIIHRDLKPSNVLAAPYDGKPVVKVIDFGVAKATGQRLTDKTLFTGFGALVGTPEYMSPEQAEVNNQDIDTRSDIYVLGVLLYELLTGSTPLTRKRLKEMPLLDVLRVIREEEPPRPSTRLSESEDTLPTIAAQRGLEPKKLSGVVRGELDWIVMKALEKDRNRRYETANGFAMDVQRYLADEPVVACPPSAAYRLRKFAQRNRAALLTMVLVGAALLTTVVALVISNITISGKEKEKSEALDHEREALREKSDALIAKDNALRDKEIALQDANANRQKAEANLKLILAALDDVYITEAEKRFAAYRNEPNNPEAAQDPRQTQLEREFLQKGIGFYEKLIQPDSAEPAARFQTGKAYRRVGILRLELKQYEKAAETLERAISLLGKLVEEARTEPQYRWELAQAYRWQGNLWANSENPQPAKAEQPFRRTVALAEELAAEFRTKPDYRVHAATCRVSMGFMLRAMNRTQEAEAEYLQALKLWQQLVDDFPMERWYRHELAYNLDSLGWLWQQTAKRPEKAEPFFRQALECHEKLVAEDVTVVDNRERLARTHEHLAQVLTSTGRFRDAQEVLRRALKFYKKLAAAHPNKPAAQEAAKSCAWQMVTARESLLSDAPQAVELAKNAIDLAPQIGPFWTILGIAHFRSGHHEKAIQALTHALTLNGANADDALFLAMAHWQLGQKEEARQWFNAGRLRMEHGLPFRWGLSDPDRLRREAEVLMGLDEAPVPAASQTKLDDPECYTRIIAAQPQAAWAYQVRGQIHRRLGNTQQADADARRAYELLKRNLPTGPDALEEFKRAGAYYLRSNNWDMVIIVDSKAIELKKDELWFYNERGWAYIVLRQWREAASDYTNAIALNPRRGHLYARRGYAYFQCGERDKALTDYFRVLELNPDYSGDSWSRYCATMLGVGLRQGKHGQAIAARAEKLARDFPDDPKYARQLHDAHSELAVAFILERRFSEGEKFYSEAIKLQPNDAMLWLRRAEFYSRLGLWDLAAKDSAAAFKLQPPLTPILCHSHALLSLYIGDLASYRQLCVLMPRRFHHETDYDVWESALACACTTTAAPEVNLAWAVQRAEKGAKRHPSAWSYCALGRARFRAGDYEQAITQFEQSLRLDSNWCWSGQSYPMLAMAHHHLGQGKKAKAALEKAGRVIDQGSDVLARGPAGTLPMLWWEDWLECCLLYREAKTLIDGSPPADDPRWLVGRAHAFAALGDRAKAEEACSRAVKMAEQNSTIRLACAAISGLVENWEQARANYEKCLELAPDSALPCNNLAWLLATCPEPKFRDSDKAVQLAKKAVALAAKEGGHWNTLGVARYRAGNWKDAVAALEKSMQLRKGGDSFDWFFLAMAHWQMGEKDKARQRYNEAVQWMEKNQPKNDELRRFRSEAEEVLKLRKK